MKSYYPLNIQKALEKKGKERVEAREQDWVSKASYSQKKRIVNAGNSSNESR